MRKLNPILIGIVLLPWMAYLSWPATMKAPAPRAAVVKVTQPPMPASLELNDVEAYENQPKALSQPSV